MYTMTKTCASLQPRVICGDIPVFVSPVITLAFDKNFDKYAAGYKLRSAIIQKLDVYN